MHPEKILSSWENGRVPTQIPWKQTVTICNWLCEEYGFTFRQGSKATHMVLAHELLRVHYKEYQSILKCNYQGEYTVCKKDNECKRFYLKDILKAYKFIREIRNEKK